MVGARQPIDDAEFERARSILSKLTGSAELRSLPYELAFVDFPGPNAVAVAGGCIGVTPSLLEEVKTEKGLAMVLAHELGHRQHRHCLEKLGRTLLFGVVLNVIVGDSDRVLKQCLDVAESG